MHGEGIFRSGRTGETLQGKWRGNALLRVARGPGTLSLSLLYFCDSEIAASHFEVFKTPLSLPSAWTDG
jgi:hypothetical protein